MTLLLTELRLFFERRSAIAVPVGVICNHDIVIYIANLISSSENLKLSLTQGKFLKFSPCSLHFQDRISHAVKGASPYNSPNHPRFISASKHWFHPPMKTHPPEFLFEITGKGL